MRGDVKTEKMKKIEQAAYDLLEQHGYDGISMLKIAKKAKSSNETLYRWYGDKKGLFHSLVQNNAEHLKAFLQSSIAKQDKGLTLLDELGTQLLELLTGKRAVALNRAAAGDPTGVLGKALAASGRDAIVPLIEDVFQHLCAQAGKPELDHAEVSELYLRLLIGDLQIRRVTGAISGLSREAILERSVQARCSIENLIEWS